MKRQHKLIYGDSLSPILAHFQNMPLNLLARSVVSIVRWLGGSKARLPFLVAVHDGWEYGVQVCRGADEEEDNQEQALEVEEGRLQGSR